MSPSATHSDILIDTVAELSSPLCEALSLSPLVQLLTLAYRIRTPSPSKQERLVTLLNTLSPLASLPQDADPRVRIGSYIRFLSPVLSGFAGMADFEAAVGAISKPGEFRRFWDLKGKNLIAELVSDGASQRAILGSDASFLPNFVADGSSRVALTKKQGMLVLVPGNTETGDGIWEMRADETMVRRGDDSVEIKDIGKAYIDSSIL